MKMRLLLFASVCCLYAAVATAAETPATRPQPAAAGKGSAAAPRRYTVEELYKNCSDLDKKKVSLRGEAVKVTGNIMGKTWTHLQDGTGEQAKGNNDIIAMSDEGIAQIGEVVTITGTLMHHPGNRYGCVVEDATISK